MWEILEETGIAIMQWVISMAPWLAPLLLALPFMTCIPCWVVGLPLVGAGFSWVLAKLGINIACKIKRKK